MFWYCHHHLWVCRAYGNTRGADWTSGNTVLLKCCSHLRRVQQRKTQGVSSFVVHQEETRRISLAVVAQECFGTPSCESVLGLSCISCEFSLTIWYQWASAPSQSRLYYVKVDSSYVSECKLSTMLYLRELSNLPSIFDEVTNQLTGFSGDRLVKQLASERDTVYHFKVDLS